MKQRLGIAAAIMEKPDIVILDEPINALDEAGAGLIKGILDELKANGSLIIIACHDTEELNYLSDEIYEIYEGQIVSKNGEKDRRSSVRIEKYLSVIQQDYCRMAESFCILCFIWFIFSPEFRRRDAIYNLKCITKVVRTTETAFIGNI